jgi:hypothetical protein
MTRDSDITHLARPESTRLAARWRVWKSHDRLHGIGPTSRVELAVGGQRTLPLSGLATAGYQWSGSVGGPDPTAVDLELRRGDAPAGAKPGSSAPEEAVVRAIRPGRAVVRLELRRPWEGDVPAAQLLELDVEVHG